MAAAKKVEEQVLAVVRRHAEVRKLDRGAWRRSKAPGERALRCQGAVGSREGAPAPLPLLADQVLEAELLLALSGAGRV